MNKHFYLTKYFPFLRKVFINLFPKILDFTAFPSSSANINLLIEERNTYFKYSLDPKSAEAWNLELVNLLKENTVKGVKLVRIGPVNDGGYFLPDEFYRDTNWITIGLGFNFLFENELIKTNCQVFTFDHTIPGRPSKLNPRVTYLPKGWGSLSESNSDHNLITLGEMLKISNFNLNSKDFWGLKFDIEGNEWVCLDQVSKLQNKPAVIACELHGLTWGSTRYSQSDVLSELHNLLLSYSICFANGNNYSPYFMTSSYGIYEIIELTLIRKDLVQLLIDPMSENLEYISLNNSHITQMPIGFLNP